MRHPAPPLVAVILPTDCHETIAPVLDRLRQLPAHRQLEVILVSPNAQALRAAVAEESAFQAVRVCEVDTLVPLGVARATGVREALAPYVFLGETHSYLWPDALDPLLAPLLANAADITVPRFVNGNPSGSTSWAAFIVAYARWSAALKAQALEECPAYDFLARRDVLLELGHRLPTLLDDGCALNATLRARGRRLLAVPGARIDHINIEAGWPLLHEHFLIGVQIGKGRAAKWSLPRRLAYIAGSCLVPWVLLTRMRHGWLETLRTERVPLFAVPFIPLLLVAKALGEAVGTAGRARWEHAARQTLYEIRRLDYVAPGRRQ